MSGRWVEQQTPFTSLLDLCEAVEALDGYQIVGHVDFIDDLKRLEEDMNVAAVALEAAVNGVDRGTLDATLTALEGSDEELARFRGSISADVSASDASLTNLMGAMDTYNQAEEAYRSALLLHHRPPRFHHHPDPKAGARDDAWKIQIPGMSQLQHQHARDDRLLGSDVGAQRPKPWTRRGTTPPARKSNGPNQPRTTRPACPRTGHARRTRRTRRSRDREVMNIAKKNGFKVKRKVVGKKVQYALVRQR